MSDECGVRSVSCVCVCVKFGGGGNVYFGFAFPKVIGTIQRQSRKPKTNDMKAFCCSLTDQASICTNAWMAIQLPRNILSSHYYFFPPE